MYSFDSDNEANTKKITSTKLKEIDSNVSTSKIKDNIGTKKSINSRMAQKFKEIEQNLIEVAFKGKEVDKNLNEFQKKTIHASDVKLSKIDKNTYNAITQNCCIIVNGKKIQIRKCIVIFVYCPLLYLQIFFSKTHKNLFVCICRKNTFGRLALRKIFRNKILSLFKT